MKILYFEDDSDKYLEVANTLRQINMNTERVTNLGDGLSKLDEASAAGNPFEVIVTDMQFPLTPYGQICDTAGQKVIEEVHKHGSNIPVIICSSGNYRVEGAYGSVWYSKSQMWENDLINIIKSIKTSWKD